MPWPCGPGVVPALSVPGLSSNLATNLMSLLSSSWQLENVDDVEGLIAWTRFVHVPYVLSGATIGVSSSNHAAMRPSATCDDSPVETSVR